LRYEGSGSDSHARVVRFPAAEISPKRVGRPDEMAQAAVFLSSDKPSFVTGVAMAADVRKAS
jgi:NAD(P)-dependent dehydrogenase (short-subunit alcohol dehydrogenase family)